MKLRARSKAATVVLCVWILGAASVIYSLRTHANSSSSELHVMKKASGFALVNQDDQEISLRDLQGKVVVMSFFFVRCSIPSMCASTTKKFRRLQQLVEENGLSDNVIFLLITFDPEFDVPGILKRYSQLYEANLRNWHFLTGSKEVVEQVCKDYAIIHEDEESGAVRHSMITYLIDQKANVRNIYVPNDWLPEDLERSISRLVAERDQI